MALTALEARALAEYKKRNNVWDKVLERIEEEAKRGRFILIFDEEKENVRFEEHRKTVKEKIEKWGYRVSYRRVRDSDDWCGHTFHNEYTIEW